MLRNWDKICYFLSHTNAKDAICFVFHSFSLKTDISWSKLPHFLPNKLSAANHLGSGPAEHVPVGNRGSSGSLGKAKQPLTGPWGWGKEEFVHQTFYWNSFLRNDFWNHISRRTGEWKWHRTHLMPCKHFP